MLNDLPHANEPTSSADSLEVIDAICNEFEAAWQDGEQPRIEDHLDRGPGSLREELLVELLKCEVQLCEVDGDTVEQRD